MDTQRRLFLRGALRTGASAPSAQARVHVAAHCLARRQVECRTCPVGGIQMKAPTG